MKYLQTTGGLLAESAIDLIGSVCERPSGDYHEIFYHVGRADRETRASADAVQDYLDNLE